MHDAPLHMMHQHSMFSLALTVIVRNNITCSNAIARLLSLCTCVVFIDNYTLKHKKEQYSILCDQRRFPQRT